MKIAFDVDGTLLDFNNNPRWEVLDMLRFLSKKHTIIVWSGGGKEYAETIARKLMITPYISKCCAKSLEENVDLCFDDEPFVNLAKVNIQV